MPGIACLLSKCDHPRGSSECARTLFAEYTQRCLCFDLAVLKEAKKFAPLFPIRTPTGNAAFFSLAPEVKPPHAPKPLSTVVSRLGPAFVDALDATTLTAEESAKLDLCVIAASDLALPLLGVSYEEPEKHRHLILAPEQPAAIATFRREKWSKVRSLCAPTDDAEADAAANFVARLLLSVACTSMPELCVELFSCLTTDYYSLNPIPRDRLPELTSISPPTPEKTYWQIICRGAFMNPDIGPFYKAVVAVARRLMEFRTELPLAHGSNMRSNSSDERKCKCNYSRVVAAVVDAAGADLRLACCPLLQVSVFKKGCASFYIL